MTHEQLTSSWQLSNPVSLKDHDLFEGYLHQAAQFIAMVGKNYLTHQNDDSHTNMAWSIEQKKLIGRPIMGNQNFSLSLDPQRFALGLAHNQNLTSSEVSLIGKTKDEGRKALAKVLEETGLAPEKLAYISHYEIPAHLLDEGGTFPEFSHEVAAHWMAQRDNANLLLEQTNMALGKRSEVRIWPHHFDTGIYVPLEKNAKGKETKSMGVGWAISDTIAHEPYLYVYGWNANETLDYTKLPKLPYGAWHTHGWTGAYLPASHIYAQSATDQIERSLNFLESSINSLLIALNLETIELR